MDIRRQFHNQSTANYLDEAEFNTEEECMIKYLVNILLLSRFPFTFRQRARAGSRRAMDGLNRPGSSGTIPSFIVNSPARCPRWILLSPSSILLYTKATPTRVLV
jgi:hypothetical protein